VIPSEARNLLFSAMLVDSNILIYATMPEYGEPRQRLFDSASRVAVSRSSGFRRTKLRQPRDSNSFSTHRQDRPISKLLRVFAQQPFHEFNAPCGRNVGEPHKSTMRRLLDKDELSEILIHGHKDTLLQRSPFEQNSIAGISTAFA